MKKWLVTLMIVAAGLTMAIGARGYAAPPVGECQSSSGLCLPGTEPGVDLPEMPHRVYLPVLIGERSPSPLVCDVLEIEPNSTHTDAQAMLATCVAGNASFYGDSDWYRLEVCSPVDLRLVLEGPDEIDLDLYLFGDPPGWPLYSSETAYSSHEQITATNLITGTYYAHVNPLQGQGDYVLNVGVTRGPDHSR